MLSIPYILCYHSIPKGFYPNFELNLPTKRHLPTISTNFFTKPLLVDRNNFQNVLLQVLPDSQRQARPARDPREDVKCLNRTPAPSMRYLKKRQYNNNISSSNNFSHIHNISNNISNIISQVNGWLSLQSTLKISLVSITLEHQSQITVEKMLLFLL